MKEQLRSLEPPWAYTIFGWLLGTIAPFLLFLSFHLTTSLKDGKALLPANKQQLELLLFPLLLNVICSVSGAIMGLMIGLVQFIFWRKKWIYAVALSPVLGIIWGIVTGAAGGVLVLIIGAFVGVIAAVPYSFSGFILFASIYEPLARQRVMRWWHILLLSLGIVILLSVIVSPILMFLLFSRNK